MRWPWQPRWIEIGGTQYRWVERWTHWTLAREDGACVADAIGGSAYITFPYVKKVGEFINSKLARRAIEEHMRSCL